MKSMQKNEIIISDTNNYFYKTKNSQHLFKRLLYCMCYNSSGLYLKYILDCILAF